MTYSLPEFPNLPVLNGRILIGGTLRSDGFETRPVFSSCHRGDKPVQLGTTPHVTSDVLTEAVAAAAKAWAKGLGEWPMARMEDRIKAVAKFRVAIVRTFYRQTLCFSKSGRITFEPAS